MLLCALLVVARHGEVMTPLDGWDRRLTTSLLEQVSLPVLCTTFHYQPLQNRVLFSLIRPVRILNLSSWGFLACCTHFMLVPRDNRCFISVLYLVSTGYSGTSFSEASMSTLENGYTALHFAALSGRLACARILVEGRADVEIVKAPVPALGLHMLDIPLVFPMHIPTPSWPAAFQWQGFGGEQMTAQGSDQEQEQQRQGQQEGQQTSLGVSFAMVWSIP